MACSNEDDINGILAAGKGGKWLCVKILKCTSLPSGVHRLMCLPTVTRGASF